MSLSNYLEQKLLDHVLRNTAYTPPAIVYLGLFTVTPADGVSGTEVPTAGGSAYARQPLAVVAASSVGVTSNSAIVTFPASVTDWGVIVAIGIFDAVSGGNLLWYGPLNPTRNLDPGHQPSFDIGELDFALE
jgi:hypothetical protein